MVLTKIAEAAVENKPEPTDFWGRSISELIEAERRETDGIKLDHVIDGTYDTPQFVLGGQFD